MLVLLVSLLVGKQYSRLALSPPFENRSRFSFSKEQSHLIPKSCTALPENGSVLVLKTAAGGPERDGVGGRVSTSRYTACPACLGCRRCVKGMLGKG